MKIIVNSDDLGISKLVNDRTIDLISRGRITSATLIANAPEIEDAVRRIPVRAGCSFGIHLNLTEFTPLTPKEECGDLHEVLDSSGRFAGEEALRRAHITAGVRKVFLNEWRLQVRKLLSMGVKISHFDSHNHVHTMPALFSVLKQLQKDFGIRKVRTTWNVYPLTSPARFSLLLKKRLWDIALRNYYRTTTTSAFTSFAVFYERAKMQTMNFESVEVMVHPGHPHFEAETQLLEKDWRKELGFKTEPISYDGL